jgi:hypothetical protein
MELMLVGVDEFIDDKSELSEDDEVPIVNAFSSTWLCGRPG